MRIDLAPDADIAATLAGHRAESLVLVTGGDGAALAVALDRLAIARAPDGRVNAVVAGPSADPAAVAAAVAYLDGARSTTGQILSVA